MMTAEKTYWAKKFYITQEQMSAIEWFHLQEDTEELRKILRAIEACPADEPMRSREEIQKRINVLHEVLAQLYGKGMPYREERLAARIDEDKWILNISNAKEGPT